MKRVGFLYALMFVCLSAGGVTYGQSEARKACPFNVVGTWRSEAATENPILFRFAPDGTVTLLSASTAIPNSDFETLAAVSYKLDKPSAPTRLDIIAARGNEVFGRGTTAMEIVEYGDDSFTTIHPVDGRRTHWVRAKTNRYFLTFAARRTQLTGYSDDSSQKIDPKVGRPNGAAYGGPAFAMWTKLDGRKTEVETLGLYLRTEGVGRMVPVVGAIPSGLYKEFLKESDKDSDVMMRLELSEAEFERTHKVFKIWEKRAQDKTLLYDEPYLNAMEFLRRTAESLNQCGERVKLHKLDWLQNDEIVSRHHIPAHPLEYIRDMRKKNDKLHVTDARFPADWRPGQF
ncbi:MAG TPA: hypothetical protein VM864_14415 [Pyrinomonadaceae bacterium]|jgi:hypothetical protein|nr:hypothetical protein [Pyrinomonadaceae bacterium]